MTRTATDTDSVSPRATQLTLRIWHPDCWTLESTGQVDAGLIAHGVYHTADVTSARVTTYADCRNDIDDFVETIEASRLTDEVKRVHDYFNPRLRTNASAGNTTEELLVEYRSCNSIHDAFVQQGFVPEEDIRIHDGEEYWTVIITESRDEIDRRLDAIRRERGADISVEGMKSPRTPTTHDDRTDHLSERQREVFELARSRGYYTWPRETSASDLADEMAVSKTTLLEHLRKAEAKLLGTYSSDQPVPR